MAKFAAKTEVPAEKSRMEIESILRRYGADAFSYGWEEGRAVVAFRAHNRQIRFEISMPDRNDPKFTQYKRGDSTFKRTPAAAEKEWEQATRQRWRALALVVKAKLEAVDAGISEFQEEFLAHIVLPDGTLLGKYIAPHIAKTYDSGQMPQRLLLSAAGDDQTPPQ